MLVSPKLTAEEAQTWDEVAEQHVDASRAQERSQHDELIDKLLSLAPFEEAAPAATGKMVSGENANREREQHVGRSRRMVGGVVLPIGLYLGW